MGDSPDANLVVLLLPVLLTPLFAAMKWLLQRLVPQARRPRSRFLWLVALAETFLPGLSLGLVLLAQLAIARVGLPEGIFATRSGFLFFLYLLALAVNYPSLKWAGKANWPLAFLFAAGPCIVFALAWELGGRALLSL